MGDVYGTVATAREVEEQVFCLDGKLRGMTYAQIADLASVRFGKPFSISTAQRRATAELNERRALRSTLVDELRAEEVEKLDRMARTQEMLIEVAAKRLDPDTHQLTLAGEAGIQNAQTQLLRIHERRARLLGLEAPIVAEVTVMHVDPADVELQRMIDHAASLAVADDPTREEIDS